MSGPAGQEPDLAALLPDVALKLLGNPTLRAAGEWRWRRHGSFAADLQKGTWFDHEAGTGGGTLALIERQLGLRGAEAFRWLRDERLIPELAPKPRGGTAATNEPFAAVPAAPREKRSALVRFGGRACRFGICLKRRRPSPT